ncbi:pyridoxal-phosphate dependent enzyme [Vulcanisaeta souniana]|uniref:threonine synthase n=1 Tax=Vulcanisaeta souniana TaxID=164452 RepID=UPI0006D1AB3D|nr:pyridoxal-phosphate dependent enzyme [Vulcanisaeta souniana]
MPKVWIHGAGDYLFCPPRCGFPLITEPRDALRIDREKPSILRYASALNYGNRAVTLGGEGFTRIRRINGVLIKDESRNPTGSFMDRGSSVLISNVTSNEIRISFEEDFALSIATYASTVGVRVRVYVNPDTAGAYPELLRLSTMKSVNIEFREGGQDLSARYGEPPLFLDGIKTIAYELYEQVGKVEGVVLPMERGYLALAIYEGFRELRDWGFIDELPRLVLVKHRNGLLSDVANWLIEGGRS